MKIKILLIAICIASFNSLAQTPVPGGNVNGTWTFAGSPYNIQGSIMVPNGQTLTIEPGVTVNFQGSYKMLVLGQLLAIGTETDTITFTAVNITNGWRGIRFDNTTTNNDTSKIIYCKLQFGKATGASPDDKGGAFYFDNFSKAIIFNCRIINCAANASGGGIYCSTSSPNILKNTISNNLAGGGNGGGIACFSSNSTIFNNTISNNTVLADMIASRGGGIYCQQGNPNITFNIIHNNSAVYGGLVGGAGGGIYCLGNANISNNSITNNSGPEGAGIYCSDGSSPYIFNNTISNNMALSVYSNLGNGGGIYCSGYSSPYIFNNTIFNNTASFYGGGIYSGDTISNNTISNNTASYGGGVYCDVSNLSISNNIIVNNTATYGGGILCNGNNSSILNNTIANNDANQGGALCCIITSNPTLRNSILWGNTATISGAQLFLIDEASDPYFYYCDVQNGIADFGLNGNFYLGTYQNNINNDPQFVLPSAGSGTSYNGVIADWSLQSTSPCINAGDPSGSYPATDIAGNPRVVGSYIDIGAYEFEGITNIITYKLQNQIIVYPNPASEYITIETTDISKEHTISIYNMQGQLLLQQPKQQPKTKIDIGKLAKGVYVIKLSTVDGIAVRKFIKE